MTPSLYSPWISTQYQRRHKKTIMSRVGLEQVSGELGYNSANQEDRGQARESNPDPWVIRGIPQIGCGSHMLGSRYAVLIFEVPASNTDEGEGSGVMNLVQAATTSSRGFLMGSELGGSRARSPRHSWAHYIGRTTVKASGPETRVCWTYVVDRSWRPQTYLPFAPPWFGMGRR